MRDEQLQRHADAYVFLKRNKAIDEPFSRYISREETVERFRKEMVLTMIYKRMKK